MKLYLLSSQYAGHYAMVDESVFVRGSVEYGKPLVVFEEGSLFGQWYRDWYRSVGEPDHPIPTIEFKK